MYMLFCTSTAAVADDLLHCLIKVFLHAKLCFEIANTGTYTICSFRQTEK